MVVIMSQHHNTVLVYLRYNTDKNICS